MRMGRFFHYCTSLLSFWASAVDRVKAPKSLNKMVGELVVEPTQFEKYALVKLDHLPRDLGKNSKKKCLKPPPSWGVGGNCLAGASADFNSVLMVFSKKNHLSAFPWVFFLAPTLSSLFTNFNFPSFQGNPKKNPQKPQTWYFSWSLQIWTFHRPNPYRFIGLISHSQFPVVIMFPHFPFLFPGLHFGCSKE